ncbi:MAG: hypothetical protein K9J30_07900 [Bacteroidales bacterium]|nr:hypothetical protein [Bacteroidales bacterium]
MRTVMQQGSISMTLEREPPPELIGHIENTYLGTPGGLQYHHTSGIEKLRNIKNCYFVLLRRSGKMLGSIGYVLRDTRAGDNTYRSWLIRYMSAKAPLRTDRTSKKKIKKRSIAERSASMLKDVTHIFHNNPERLVDFDISHIPKAIIYAIVEKENERSRNFAEIGGFSKIGQLESFIFSCLRKRDHHKVERLKAREIPKMKQLLDTFYHGHAFYFTENLFLNDQYFVIRKDGEIVAGLQANPESWEVRTVGNKFLDRIIRVLTRIPFIGKRFRYEEMRFLGVEGIYFREGDEKSLYHLLEGVLGLMDQYLALMILDVRSPEYNAFRKMKKLGPVNFFLGSFNADIYAKFFSFPEEEKQEVCSRPAYISIYDNT